MVRGVSLWCLVYIKGVTVCKSTAIDRLSHGFTVGNEKNVFCRLSNVCRLATLRKPLNPLLSNPEESTLLLHRGETSFLHAYRLRMETVFHCEIETNLAVSDIFYLVSLFREFVPTCLTEDTEFYIAVLY